MYSAGIVIVRSAPRGVLRRVPAARPSSSGGSRIDARAGESSAAASLSLNESSEKSSGSLRASSVAARTTA